MAAAFFGTIMRLVPWDGGGMMDHRLYQAEYEVPASVAFALGCRAAGIVLGLNQTGSYNTPLF